MEHGQILGDLGLQHLKKHEEEFHAENLVFITVSLDRANSVDKWKKYVKDHGLTGLQVNIPLGTKAPVAKDYMLAGVPRYVIIDEKGLIVDAFAPRPSDPKLRNRLKSLLNRNLKPLYF